MGTVRLSEVRTAWGAWLRGRGRAGKVRCWRLSNTPEWYVAKLATLAVARALPGPIALQYFYAPVNREIEDEHVPREGEFDMGLVPWSPLAYGLLSGKYDRATVEETGPRAGGLPKEAAPSGEARPADDWRLDGANPIGDSLFTQRNGNIVEGVRRVAETVGQTPAPVALASVVGRSAVASTLMGVSRPAQVVDNIAARDLVFSSEHRATLDAISAPAEPRLIRGLSRPPLRQAVVFGGAQVRVPGERP